MFVPFDANPAGTLEPGKNFAAWVDSFIVLAECTKKPDPEGCLVPFRNS